MEKIVLSRPTYNRLSDGANIANDLANKATSPKGIEPPRPRNRQYLAQLTAETTIPNGGLTWKAVEVYLDEVGAVVVKPNGFEWTDTNPILTLSASKANDVIMVSQTGRPAIDPDPAKRYWIGGSISSQQIFYFEILNILSHTPTAKYVQKYSCDLYSNIYKNTLDTKIGTFEVYLTDYFTGYKNVNLPNGFKGGVVSYDPSDKTYFFSSLEDSGRATISSKISGNNYSATVQVAGASISGVTVSAPNIGFGDLSSGQAFQCRFKTDYLDANSGSWIINPATFGTADAGVL